MTERAGYGIRKDYKLLNWEQNEFPIVCDSCLGSSKYIRMLKKPLGAECKICTRPFSVFNWKPKSETGRIKKTEVCSTCAKINNCCQACVYDLLYNLPINLRNKLMGDKKVELLMSEGNRDIFAHLANENIDQLQLPYEEHEALIKRKPMKQGPKSNQKEEQALDQSQKTVVQQFEQAKQIVGTAENQGSCFVGIRYVHAEDQEEIYKKIGVFFEPEQFDISFVDLKACIKFDKSSRAVKFMKIFAANFVVKGKLLQVYWLDNEGREIAQGDEKNGKSEIEYGKKIPKPPIKPFNEKTENNDKISELNKQGIEIKENEEN